LKKLFEKIMSDNKMSTFPRWLSETLIGDTVNWFALPQIDPLALRQMITLHDSTQVKVLIDSAWDGYVMIAVRWDTYWNKDILEYPGDAVARWPFLIIQIEGVSKIEISDFAPIGGIQRTVSDIEPEKIEEQYRTRLMDVYGGKIDFTHTQGFRLALFSADGERLEIEMPNKSVVDVT
jgi:hypothetical protein